MKNLQFRFESIDIIISLRKTQILIIFRYVLWKGSSGRPVQTNFAPLLDPSPRSNQGVNDKPIPF